MHELGWIRWYMVAFFVAFGVSMLLRRRTFAAAACAFPRVALDEPARARLRSAYCKRQEREALPSVAMARILGGMSLALACVAALTTASVALLYAALTVVMAGVLTGAYVRLRRSESRRVASLRVRDASDVVPSYAWAAVATASVLPLLWLRSVPIASLTATVAGVAIALLARRVATMPALLLGEDLGVERFVDERLRAVRTTHLLALAIAPGYVFEAFSGFTDSVAHVFALLFGLVVLALTLWLHVGSLRGRPSPLQMAEWSYAAP